MRLHVLPSIDVRHLEQWETQKTVSSTHKNIYTYMETQRHRKYTSTYIIKNIYYPNISHSEYIQWEKEPSYTGSIYKTLLHGTRKHTYGAYTRRTLKTYSILQYTICKILNKPIPTPKILNINSPKIHVHNTNMFPQIIGPNHNSSFISYYINLKDIVYLYMHMS